MSCLPLVLTRCRVIYTEVIFHFRHAIRSSSVLPSTRSILFSFERSRFGCDRCKRTLAVGKQPFCVFARFFCSLARSVQSILWDLPYFVSPALLFWIERTSQANHPLAPIPIAGCPRPPSWLPMWGCQPEERHPYPIRHTPANQPLCVRKGSDIVSLSNACATTSLFCSPNRHSKKLVSDHCRRCMPDFQLLGLPHPGARVPPPPSLIPPNLHPGNAPERVLAHLQLAGRLLGFDLSNVHWHLPTLNTYMTFINGSHM